MSGHRWLPRARLSKLSGPCPLTPSVFGWSTAHEGCEKVEAGQHTHYASARAKRPRHPARTPDGLSTCPMRQPRTKRAELTANRDELVDHVIEGHLEIVHAGAVHGTDDLLPRSPRVTAARISSSRIRAVGLSTDAAGALDALRFRYGCASIEAEPARSVSKERRIVWKSGWLEPPRHAGAITSPPLGFASYVHRDG
jgi:hypothetical protein